MATWATSPPPKNNSKNIIKNHLPFYVCTEDVPHFTDLVPLKQPSSSSLYEGSDTVYNDPTLFPSTRWDYT